MIEGTVPGIPTVLYTLGFKNLVLGFNPSAIGIHMSYLPLILPPGVVKIKVHTPALKNSA
ncbi:hypothetical protein SDC9_174530 [bioreactor metagenome]|uniref:Uncharacterized protein n=1 Tax=bioreactor metagenome TaxID=1076179 RepID=A0A645GTX3_9ZZZZ